MTADALERWRVTRDPALADTLTDDPPAIVTRLWKATSIGDATQVLLDMARCADDPRMTQVFVRCLHAARWPSVGGARVWSLIFERLIVLRDVRAIATLERAAEDLPLFEGVAHVEWMRKELAATAAALRAACAGLPEPKKVSPGFARHDPAEVALPIVETVWRAPEDDAARLVAADALLERNHPWGEFITLAFKVAEGASTPAMAKRLATLQRVHGTVFGGPIARICTKDAWAFEKGFLVAVAANRSMVARQHWEAAAHAPHWATVQRLKLGGHAPLWWKKTILGNAATANLRTIEAQGLRLQRSARGGAWTVAMAEPHVVPAVTSLLQGMSPDDRAQVSLGDAIHAEVRARLAPLLS